MREIQLTKGYVALVDDGDYARVSQHKWCAQVQRSKGRIRHVYARHSVGKPGAQTTQLMHCFIMGTKGIDHEDGNGLHNWRGNLRPATKKQNSHSRRVNVNSSSGHKGVTWHKAARKWEAKIGVNYNNIYLGCFTDILDARDAYDVAALKYHGNVALTNCMLSERPLAVAA